MMSQAKQNDECFNDFTMQAKRTLGVKQGRKIHVSLGKDRELKKLLYYPFKFFPLVRLSHLREEKKSAQRRHFVRRHPPPRWSTSTCKSRGWEILCFGFEKKNMQIGLTYTHAATATAIRPVGGRLSANQKSARFSLFLFLFPLHWEKKIAEYSSCLVDLPLPNGQLKKMFQPDYFSFYVSEDEQHFLNAHSELLANFF